MSEEDCPYVIMFRFVFITSKFMTIVTVVITHFIAIHLCYRYEVSSSWRWK